MDRCRQGDKPLSEPMMVSLLTYICVSRPQWVKNTHTCTCDIPYRNVTPQLFVLLIRCGVQENLDRGRIRWEPLGHVKRSPLCIMDPGLPDGASKPHVVSPWKPRGLGWQVPEPWRRTWCTLVLYQQWGLRVGDLWYWSVSWVLDDCQFILGSLGWPENELDFRLSGKVSIAWNRQCYSQNSYIDIFWCQILIASKTGKACSDVFLTSILDIIENIFFEMNIK